MVHEPERQLRRRRQSLNDRLELEGEEQPTIQEAHEQQKGDQRGPESFGEAWVYNDVIEEVVRGIVDQVASESESDEPASEGEPKEEAQVTEGAGVRHVWTMDEGNAGYGYQGPRFEFGMCTYDTSDSIRRYIGANRRRCTLPDGTVDDEQAKMVILTCMTSTVASRLEVAVDMDCRPRDADEQCHAVPVRRDFLDANTTCMRERHRFLPGADPPRTTAPPIRDKDDIVAWVCCSF